MRRCLMVPVTSALTVLLFVGCSQDQGAVAEGALESSRTLGFDPAELNNAVHPLCQLGRLQRICCLVPDLLPGPTDNIEKPLPPL